MSVFQDSPFHQHYTQNCGMQVKKRRVDDKRAQLVALEFQPAQVEAALAKLGGDCDVQAAVELILSGQAMPPLGGQTQPNSELLCCQIRQCLFPPTACLSGIG